MALTFRSLYKWMLPGSYSEPGTDGEKVLHSLALLKDAFDQIAHDRLTWRFPSYSGESGLALLGADRGILRGRSETKDHYVQRLLSWRWPRGHRVRGNGFALIASRCSASSVWLNGASSMRSNAGSRTSSDNSGRSGCRRCSSSDR